MSMILDEDDYERMAAHQRAASRAAVSRADENEKLKTEINRLAAELERWKPRPMSSAPKECECKNWAVADIGLLGKGNGHHPNCDKYEKDTAPDQRFAVFGQAIWRLITKSADEFCSDEWAEEVMPLAVDAGLCRRVAFDPQTHAGVDAEVGSMIWWWGTNDELKQLGGGK